jgi:hypothetical protein
MKLKGKAKLVLAIEVMRILGAVRGDAASRINARGRIGVGGNVDDGRLVGMLGQPAAEADPHGMTHAGDVEEKAEADVEPANSLERFEKKSLNRNFLNLWYKI